MSACPDNALEAKPIDDVLSIEDKHWAFSKSLPVRNKLMDASSVKGSQLHQPLLEFSGACEGCGETPYVKVRATYLYKALFSPLEPFLPPYAQRCVHANA